MEGSVMEMVFLVPGKHRPRMMRVEGCKRPLDGFAAVLAKYPDAQFLSFNGYPYRNKT